MPTCFVVMGFGKKTDFKANRVLDLDKSYKNIIKPAVKRAGFECIRADEIPHSGNINVPMYEQLLNADVVIADVSTYNENAFYELGVRHALKPYTTITIAEDGLKFPFDINNMLIRQYHHLGEDIGFDEAMRMQDELAEAIQIVAKNAKTDSPVYTFLTRLKPPTLPQEDVAQAAQTIAAQAPTAAISGEAATAPAAVADSNQVTVRALMDQVDAAMKRSDFVMAKGLLMAVRAMMPNDSYIVQKLALATYKAKLPDPVAALKEAEQLLLTLSPETSTDTETLGLYGSVQKQLWDKTKDPSCMDKAIWALEKGFYVKNDYYNGINLAYMLNVRAAEKRDAAPAEAVADFITAQRTRQKVLPLCEAALHPAPPAPEPGAESRFWILATMSQAWAGIDDAKSQQLLDEARQLNQPQWMTDSTVEQLDKLKALQAKSPLDLIKEPGKAQNA